ncbi:MAG: hypothetical protein RR588_12395 [Solibacillus sp.]
MIRAKHPIRHNGKQYKKGAILDGLTAKEEKRLVTLKSAEYIINPEEELQQQQVSGQSFTILQEKFDELSAALNSLYNAEDLKREALDVGVDLTGITRKDDVIAAIINQGKSDELLEDDEDLNNNGQQ